MAQHHIGQKLFGSGLLLVVVGTGLVVEKAGAVVGIQVVVLVVEDITTGVWSVVDEIVVEPEVKVCIVVVVVIFLTAQQRHVPCPGSGVHLSSWQLSSTTSLSSLAISSLTHTWPGRAEHWVSWQSWQQMQGICSPGGRVPPPGTGGRTIGGNCLLSSGWLHSLSSVHTPSSLLRCGWPTSTAAQCPPYW